MSEETIIRQGHEVVINRGRGGRFARKGSATAQQPSKDLPAVSPAPATGDDDRAATVRRLIETSSTAKLNEVFAWLVKQGDAPGVLEALQTLDAELARREGRDALSVDDDEHSRAIDRAVAGGASYAEAFAEAHGLDVEQAQREERMQLVEAYRRPGERRRDTLRRMYAEQVYVSYLQAETDTRGNLLSPAGIAQDAKLRRKGGAGLDPVSLFSGSATAARAYASDELKQWWEDHGGRQPFVVWSAPYTGDKAAAERSRRAGTGKDHGV